MILISSWSHLCSILWSQVLSREWRCSWSSADRRCSNYIWVIDSLIAYQGASYIRDLTVTFKWFSMLRVNSPQLLAQCVVYNHQWSTATLLQNKNRWHGHEIHQRKYFCYQGMHLNPYGILFIIFSSSHAFFTHWLDTMGTISTIFSV